MKKIYLILLMLLFILTRLYHLLVLPPFLDELIYIRWLNTIKFTGDWLVSLKEFGWEPLGIWLAGIINLVFPDQLFSLRLNSIIISFLSLLMVYKLAGNLAVLFYVLSPIILLHDRLGLRGDNLVILGALMVYYGLQKRLVANKSVSAIWVGLGIAIGLFAKTTAAALPIVVILSYLWFRPKLKLADFIAAFLSLMPIFFYWLTGTLGQVINKQSTFIGGSLIKNNFLQIIPWLYQYLAWPVLLLVIGGLVVTHKNKLLLLSCLVPLVLLIISAKILFPRYLLSFIPFLLMYAADGFHWLNHQLPRVLKPLLIIFILAPAWFCWQITTNLLAAPLPEIDQWQYITGWPSGYGVKELVDYLQANQLDQLLTYSQESLLTDTATASAYAVTNISHEKINGELVKEFPRPGNKSSLKLWHLN